MDSSVGLSLFEKFVYVRWAYSLGEEVIPNDEYNLLREVIEEEYPNSPYVNRSWSSDPCPKELLERIGRTDLIERIILSDKTESIPTLNTDAALYSTLSKCSGRATVSMKHDGWNIQASYYNGRLVRINTRGRSSDAIDVSGLMSKIPETIPADGSVKVVMELTISKHNFITVRAKFNNVSCRSAVSTILARKEYYDLLDCTGLAIHGYNLSGKCKFEVLRDWGFSTPMYIEVFDYDDVLRAIQTLSAEEQTYQHPTDGVVYAGEALWAIRLGAWEEPIYKSYVTGYLEKYRSYRISPSCLIHPIVRKDVTQRQVSMTNWQRIMDYDLQPGAPIAFRIASSATADFDEEATKALHVQYTGRWDEFHELIDSNEQLAESRRAVEQSVLGGG